MIADQIDRTTQVDIPLHGKHGEGDYACPGQLAVAS